MLKSSAILLALALVAAVGMQAIAAVPPAITYQGRLTLSDSIPYTGIMPVVFKIYSGAGFELWNSGSLDVTFEDGLFTVRLGDLPQAALTPEVFADTAVTLGITVDTNPEMTPRTRFSTHPFAFVASRADTAQNVAGGSVGSAGVDRSQVQLRVASACGEGQFIRAIDEYGNVTCDSPVSTTYSAGTGIAIVGSVISLNSQGCTSGEILKWNGSAWDCVSETGDISAVTAGSGLTGGGSTGDITLAIANNGVTSSKLAPPISLEVTSTQPVIGGSNYGTGHGIFGEAVYGTGVFGVSGDGNGIYGGSTNNNGIYGYTSSSGQESGVYGTCNGYGLGSGVSGYTATGECGVYGQNDHPSAIYAAGVKGVSTSNFGTGVEARGDMGVYAVSETNGGTGVYGSCNLGPYAYGVWGKSTSGYGVFAEGPTAVYATSASDGGEAIYAHGFGSNTEGVLGVSEQNIGVYGVSNATSGNNFGVWGQADNGIGVIGTSSSGTAIKAFGAFVATGTKSAEVKLDDGTPIRLYSEEATEVCFADYGSATLLGGTAHIELDPEFLQTVTIDDEHPMMVFVQLEGDCRGVFVTDKTATGFDVVELQGGVSNVPFSYRVVCKRKFYEDERLATREAASGSNIRMMEAAWPEVIAEHREKGEELKRLDRQAEEYRMKRQKIDELEAEQKSGRKIQPFPLHGKH